MIIPGEIKKITQKFVGKEPMIIEPMRRNTAPAICLAAMALKREFGDGMLHIMPADHLISKDRDFIAALRFGEELAQKGYLVCYGVKPTRPETGYGYIKVGTEIDADLSSLLSTRHSCGDTVVETQSCKNIKAFQGEKFTEKPSLQRAKDYLRKNEYLWNSGIFTFRIGDILSEIKKFIPEVHNGVANYLKTKKKRYFSKIPDVSIDYGVMEKSARLCIIRGNFLWDDLGSWLALERCFEKDKNRNIFIGNAMGLEIADSIVYTYGIPVKAYGVKGLIIVVSPYGVLVCKKDRAADLKKLLKK